MLKFSLQHCFLIPILISAKIDENIRCYESIIVCMKKLIYISQVEDLRWVFMRYEKWD